MDARTIAVDGRRVRVIDVAPAHDDGEAVVMIHGLGGWAENWRPLIPAIVESGRRAVAVDLPGFGASERVKRARYFDPDEPFYAGFVFRTLDALGIERAHVAGHSFGASVAYMAAVTCPERVRSLTLIAPGGLGRDLARSFRVLALPGVGLLAGLVRSEGATRDVLHACFHDPARCPAETMEEALRYGAPSVGEMARVLRSAVTFRRGIRDEVRRPWIARRGRYTGPALVVWGREDRVLPSSEADEVREIAPQADVRLIGSCGHLVMIERPRELLDVLLPFLEGAGRPA